jgi:hypothetical protein
VRAVVYKSVPSQEEGSTMRTHRSLLSFVTVLALVLVAGSAHVAQAQDKPAKGGGGDKGGKVKVYDFSGDTIEGDLIKPEGSTVDARDFAKHSSLIRIRKDFIPEIIKSAEDL